MEGTSGAVQAGSFRERLRKAALMAGRASRSTARRAIRSSQWFRVDRKGSVIRTVALRFVFPEAGRIGERQEVSGLRRVGVNPPLHADAEVGRSEIAPAIDEPLSRQHPVGDAVRGAVTQRAVACHREAGVWGARGRARGSFQLLKSTSGTWPSRSNRKGRASRPEREGESRKGCECV